MRNIPLCDDCESITPSTVDKSELIEPFSRYCPECQIRMADTMVLDNSTTNLKGAQNVLKAA